MSNSSVKTEMAARKPRIGLTYSEKKKLNDAVWNGLYIYEQRDCFLQNNSIFEISVFSSASFF